MRPVLAESEKERGPSRFTATAPPIDGVHEVSVGVLRAYGCSTPGFAGTGWDAGPAVLIAQVRDVVALGRGAGADVEDLVSGAEFRWVSDAGGAVTGPGVHGGLAGVLVGARELARHSASYQSLVTSTVGAMGVLDGLGSRSGPLSWRDYDLISGPSGVVTVLALEGSSAPAAQGAIRNLAQLASAPRMAGFRLDDFADDEALRWNYGRINTGVAHGVAGVALALAAAARTAGSDTPELVRCLTDLGYWLAGEVTEDGNNVLVWQPAGPLAEALPSPPSRRQAWCYGTPGTAWALWECAAVIGDEDLRHLAEEAMCSYVKNFDPQYYLDPVEDASHLGICHGATGILAVADAFARHTRIPEYGTFATEMEAYVADRLEDLVRLAEADMSMLSGASGALAVLLARRTGHRRWLSAIGLR